MTMNIKKKLLTEDGELEGVNFGLSEGLVGGVTGERDVPVQVWHRQGQFAVRVPAAGSRRLVSGGGLGSRLSVHYPRDLRRRVTVLRKTVESDVVPHTSLLGAGYSHVLRGN